MSDSNFDSRNGISIVDVIISLGLEADYFAGSAVRYFLRAPYFGSEADDYSNALSCLEQIHDRPEGRYKIIVGPADFRFDPGKVNFDWLSNPTTKNSMSTSQIVKSWGLCGDRAEFIENFGYRKLNILRCVRIVERLLDNVDEF